MDYIPLNFKVMLQPLNWIIVILMLIIAGYGIETVYNFIAGKSASNQELN